MSEFTKKRGFTPMLHELAASDLDITHMVSALRITRKSLDDAIAR